MKKRWKSQTKLTNHEEVEHSIQCSTSLPKLLEITMETKATKKKQKETIMNNDDQTEVVMTSTQLKELIRAVVYETVKEIRQQEEGMMEDIKAEEEAEEVTAQMITQLRTRAAYLASAMKGALRTEVKPVDSETSVELFILSSDHLNGYSIRLEPNHVTLKHNGLITVYPYDTAKDYRQASEAALIQLMRYQKAGK